MPGRPTAATEFRRGLDAYNLVIGWRFDRGIRATAAGDHPRALRLLTPVERPGMSHYDPEGRALSALASSRALLHVVPDQPPRRGRSKPARS